MPIYDIIPVAKPTETQRDKWLKPPRPAVAKYLAFREEVGWKKVKLPTFGASITFILPMPKSWSKTKREHMAARPHEQKPDLSNLLKALEDAVYGRMGQMHMLDDSAIWHYAGLCKIWGYQGQIWINENSERTRCYDVYEQDM